MKKKIVTYQNNEEDKDRIKGTAEEFRELTKSEIYRKAEDEKFEMLEGHRKPQTRREFLECGLLKFSAALVLPSVYDIVANNLAHAAECGDSGGGPVAANAYAPLVTFNLSGGAMLGANFVPHDQGGQVLANYDQMGLGRGGNLPITRAFGNVPFAGNGIANFLTGMQATMTAGTIANTAFVGVCARSRDDSGANTMDITGLVARAGRSGEKLPNLGRRDSRTGVRQEPAFVNPPVPLRVSGFSDLEGAAGGFTNALGKLSKEQQIRLFNLMKNLSAEQSRNLASVSGGQNLKDLVECATDKNIEIVSANNDTLDPRGNANVSNIWNLGNAGDRSENLVFASMVFNTINGNATAASIERGGYDYHNNTRTRGDGMDREAGEIAGRVLETAAAMGQKVFLYVTTDGSCRSTTSDAQDAPWRSDRGSAGVLYMIAYDPSGRPSTKNFQMGHFTSGQAADQAFPTGGGPSVAAAGVFANYMKFSGKESEIQSVIPNVFSNADLDRLLIFT